MTLSRCPDDGSAGPATGSGGSPAVHAAPSASRRASTPGPLAPLPMNSFLSILLYFWGSFLRVLKFLLSLTLLFTHFFYGIYNPPFLFH